MALESAVTDGILRYINGLEGGIAEKVMGNASQFGRPDINACLNSWCIRIEVKTADHGNKASAAQRVNLKKWKRAGAICMVAYSVQDVKDRLKEEGLV